MAKLSKATKALIEDRDRREFLAYVHACGVGQSLGEVQQWWYHFCNAALDWLINKERPVDFYFLKLHQSPYRQDWKDIVSRSVPHKNEGHKLKVLVGHEELLKRLTQLDLLAMQGSCCLRNVEIQHCPLWWSTSLRGERKRLKKLGPERYAKVFLESVERRLAATLHIYAEYVKQVAAAYPRDVKNRPGGGPRLRQTTRYRVLHFRSIPRDRARDSLLNILERPMPEPKHLSEQGCGLPEVYDLQRALAELRDAWGVVPQPQNGKA